jgi:hypothetical protein
MFRLPREPSYPGRTRPTLIRFETLSPSGQAPFGQVSSQGYTDQAEVFVRELFSIIVA